MGKKVEIVGRQQMNGRTHYMVSVDGAKAIPRRYQQFYEYRYLLKEKYPDFSVGEKFPGKDVIQWISGFVPSEQARMEDERERYLGKWLQAVLAHKEVGRWAESKKFIAGETYDSGLPQGVRAKLSRSLGLERVRPTGFLAEITSGLRNLPETVWPRFPEGVGKRSKKYKVWVTCVAGHDMVGMDRGGTSDPYCEIRVRDPSMAALEGATTFLSNWKETKHVPKTLNPVWNETFSFDIRDPSTAKIEIVVKDRDIGAIDDKMGSRTIGIDRFEDGRIHDKWFKLHNTTSGLVHLMIYVQDTYAEDFAQEGIEMLKKDEEWANRRTEIYHPLHAIPQGDWRPHDINEETKETLTWAVDFSVLTLAKKDDGHRRNGVWMYNVSFIAAEGAGRHRPFKRWETFGAFWEFNPSQLPPHVYEKVKKYFPNAKIFKINAPPPNFDTK